MDSKIEQVKKILKLVWQDASKWGESFKDLKSVDIWLEDKAKEINTLYPQETPQVVCQCGHTKEFHIGRIVNGQQIETYCKRCPCQYFKSLPRDELLTEIAKYITNDIIGRNWDSLTHLEKVILVTGAESILLKCHQSESTEIASLQADIEELNILSRGNSEVYEARIKELEKYKQPEYEKAILQQARADQNKKIGDWLAKTVGNGAKVSFTQEFIAKLQKGEEIE